jgi:hypothetical protein
MKPTGAWPLEARESDERPARRVRSITVRAKLKKALESARDELRDCFKNQATCLFP